MPHIATAEHRASADVLRRLMAIYRSAEDLINIGAYADGTNSEIDRAKSMMGAITEFLVESADEHCEWDGTLVRLAELAERAGR
jgi:flagellum-specific ATP synthase